MTLVFALAVGWLGWKLVEQDRALARQRRVEQLEAAADRVAGALFRRLAELEELPEAVVLRRGAGGLLYYPAGEVAASLGSTAFTASDELEFRRNDPAGAVAVLRGLVETGDVNTRAAALARMGRNLRKAGRTGEALEAYARLAGMPGAVVDGLPGELVGLEARCALLEQLGRKAELQREAAQMGKRLLSGEWRLTHAAWESQREQVVRWVGGLEVDPEKLALAAAADIVWSRGGQGREMLQAGRPVVAVWSSEGGELKGVLAPARVLDGALREASPFVATLADFEPRRADVKLWVERSPAATKLPWTIAVTAREDATGELSGRMWLLGGGFVLLVALLGGVSFVVARAVAKEMAVARLQADFVAAVSHEFRSPLSSISQISELLNEDRWPTPEHRRKGYEVLSRESARLKRLVEGLLDFARMEAGNAGYRLERVDVGELVGQVVEEFGGVELEVGAELPVVDVDREALRRAIWNLLENAVKYSVGEAREGVEVVRFGAGVAIRVRDWGMGIPAEEQRLVFQKFYRGSEAKQRRVKGTGIGLSMVKHIVEGHGGELRLESEVGRGSTFTILLPEGKQG